MLAPQLKSKLISFLSNSFYALYVSFFRVDKPPHLTLFTLHNHVNFLRVGYLPQRVMSSAFCSALTRMVCVPLLCQYHTHFRMVGSVRLLLEWYLEACARFLKFLVEVEVVYKCHNLVSHTSICTTESGESDNNGQ